MNSKKIIKSMSLLLIIMIASMSLVSAIMPIDGAGEVAISNDGVQVTGHANTKLVKAVLTNNLGRARVCTQDAKKCPDGHYVGRDSTKNCSFFPCENEDVVCCKIEPVVQNPEPTYKLVPKDSCSVPEGLLGVSKEIVNNSFCEGDVLLEEPVPTLYRHSFNRSNRLVISVGDNSLKQLRGLSAKAEVTSVRLLPGSKRALVKSGLLNEEVNLSEGFEMQFNENNHSRRLLIRSSGDLWNEITEGNLENMTGNLVPRSVHVRTRAIIRASENGLSVELKNGSAKQIKVLPLQASERAREVLKANFDDVVLKETNGKVIYQMKAHQRMKFLGLFPMNASLSAEVDADSGDVLKVKKPWFSFLSSKPKLSASVNLDAETVESNSSLEN